MAYGAPFPTLGGASPVGNGPTSLGLGLYSHKGPASERLPARSGLAAAWVSGLGRARRSLRSRCPSPSSRCSRTLPASRTIRCCEWPRRAARSRSASRREIGTLEEGKLADFVVIDGDPLDAHCRYVCGIVAVAKGGVMARAIVARCAAVILSGAFTGAPNRFVSGFLRGQILRNHTKNSRLQNGTSLSTRA